MSREGRRKQQRNKERLAMAAQAASNTTGDAAKSASVPEAAPFPPRPTIEKDVGNPSPREDHTGPWRSMFGWESIFRWDVLGALVPGVFIAVGLGMLGIEWFPHNLLISQVCFSVGAIMVMTKTIGHAYKATGTFPRKVGFCIVLCGIVLLMAIFTVLSIQAHKSTFHQSLSITALVTPAYQTNYSVAGIKWPDGFQAVRLSIDDISEDQIQNLDLTVRVLDKSGDLLGGMGQLSHISAVDFHPPDVPDLHMRLLGTDGLPYDVSSRDAFDLSGGIPWGDYWKMFCPRLPSGTQLRVLIAAVSKAKTAPRKLRLVGSYEVTSSDRNKVVRFDNILDVKRSF